MDSRSMAAAARQAILDRINSMPAPGTELGAGLPTTPSLLRSGLNWLQRHADPNPQSYARPVPRPQTIQASAAPSLPGQPAPTAPVGATGAPAQVPGAAPILSSGSFLPPKQVPQVNYGPEFNEAFGSVPKPAPAPQANPYQRASDVGALAQGNPYPSAPQIGGGGWGFNGAGFGAGDGFAPPFDMGQGSTISGQDLVQKYMKRLFSNSDT